MTTDSTQRFFLKKEDRLKKRKEIDLLFSKGKSFSEFPFRVFWQTGKDNSGLKAGFAAGSKNFKRATDRNTIKRKMREAYRLQKGDWQNEINLTGALNIFFVYTGKALPEYKLIHEKIGAAMKRLGKIIHD